MRICSGVHFPHGSSPLTLSATLVSFILLLSGYPQTSCAQEQSQPAATLAIRSSILEQLLQDSRSEQQPVAKTLLRSAVTGCQTTLTRSRLHIVPNTQPLQFEVRTQGSVSSRTTGVNPQAVVESLGSHRFEVIKPFWFDGRRFMTRQSHGTIEAFQSPQRVISAAGTRLPLLKPLTDQIAWNRVRQMQTGINQAVAADLSGDVFPKVDRRVEQEFLRIEERWKQSLRFLGSSFPQDSLEWSALALADTVVLTTESAVGTGNPGGKIARRPDPAAPDVPQPSTLAVSSSGPRISEDEDLVLTISESALSKLVSSALPRGARITDTSLQKLTELLPDILEGQPAAHSKLAAAMMDASVPATFFTLELPSSEPLTCICRNGDLQLNFRFRILPLIGSDSGWMTAALAIRGKRLDAKHWTLAVRDITVNSAAENPTPSPGTDESVSAGTVWPTLVRTRLAALLESAPEPSLPVDFLLPVTGGVADAVPASLQLHQADARNGHLRISFSIATAKKAAERHSPADPSQ